MYTVSSEKHAGFQVFLRVVCNDFDLDIATPAANPATVAPVATEMANQLDGVEFNPVIVLRVCHRPLM